jgi:hypothetical protein
MKLTSRFPRILVAAACAAGVSGAAALPADAASAPAVGPVTLITPESAVLSGAVDTGNLAPGTSFTFEYDTLSDWNSGANNALFGGPFFADASPNLSFVTAQIGCFPATSCTFEQTPLTPGTTYVYEIQTQPGVSSNYATAVGLTSATGLFRTGNLGKIAFKSSKVTVAHGKAEITLKCTSSVACAGKIVLKAGGKTVASGKFHALGTATVAIKFKGSAALKAAGGSLSAQATLTSSTDQKNAKAAVTITS